jgi:signal transduction histidine kinase
MMIAPLLAHDKPLGVIVLVATAASRPFDHADLNLAQQLAERMALCIENARLYGKAQRAVGVRDEVLAIVAHDLRGPLGTILGQMGLLKLGAPAPERRFQKAAQMVERAVGHMNRLINDLLDVSRIDAGVLSVEQRRISSAQLVADVTDTQKPAVTAAGLELEVELSRNLPEVWADRDRLLQVFENLIGNAVKFTPPGGRIKVGAKPREQEVLFWVGDTGSGIAAADVPHVFDRFWQARRLDHRGAGLGLQIVKGIVEAHGGRVWVDSTPSIGSTFFLTIPVPPRPNETAASPVHDSP